MLQVDNLLSMTPVYYSSKSLNTRNPELLNHRPVRTTSGFRELSPL
jgi:hypothetical protein